MKAFILAAGLGTRLKPFTNFQAKPTLDFLGLPQILYAYAFLKHLGVQEVAANTHHAPQSVLDILTVHKLDVQIFHEPKLLSSGGGLVQARDFWQDDELLVVLNGDSYFYEPLDLNLDFQKKLIDFKKSNSEVCFFVQKVKESWEDKPPSLMRYDEESKNFLSKGPFTSGKEACGHYLGLAVFKTSYLKRKKESVAHILNDYVLPDLERNPSLVQIEELNVNFTLELGTFEGYRKAHKKMKAEFESGKSYKGSFLKTVLNEYQNTKDMNSFAPEVSDQEKLILEYKN